MKAGFFNKSQLGTGTRKIGTSCISCGLYKKCDSPKMNVEGEGKKGLFIWTGGIHPREDRRGLLLVGEQGTEIRRILTANNIDLDTDCWMMSSVNCATKKDGEYEKPTSFQTDNCRHRVWDTITELKPKAILLLGETAVESFLGHRWMNSDFNIIKWRGWSIPDRDTNCWVVPSFSPSYLEGGEIYKTVFKQDVKRVIGLLDTPFLEQTPEEECIRILNETDAIEYMKNIYRSAIRIKNPLKFLMAFDFEATGLKPHADGHEIVCCSICVKSHEAISFLMTPEIAKWLVRLLTCIYIGKMAHNMKFEHLWSDVKLFCTVFPWYFDTMLDAHVQDPRGGITGLKFQLYVQLGTPDYSSDISHLLRGEKNNANSFNQIHKIPKRKLLLYCGIDSLGQYRLAYKYLEQFTRVLYETRPIRKG